MLQPGGSVHGERANFAVLVLFCIDASDSESRRIFQHFSRSTRFSLLRTAPQDSALRLRSWLHRDLRSWLHYFCSKSTFFASILMKFSKIQIILSFERCFDSKGAKECIPSRFRKVLQNAPTLAIGDVDTAENGPSKVREVTNKIRRSIAENA